MTALVLPLILFLVPLAYSPGPGNLFFAANGARFGVLATGPALFGYHAATLIVTLAIGMGLGTAMQATPALSHGLRLLGAAYVFWLALKFLRAGSTTQQIEAQSASILDGAILLVLNPKAYVIIGLMFSQFLTATADLPTHVLLIATVFTANNLVAFLVWTIAGDLLGRLFRSERASGVLNLIFGGLLVAVAIWMLLP